MSRGLVVILCAAAAAAAVGCSHQGRYELAWEFAGATGSPPPPDGGVAGDGGLGTDAAVGAAIDDGGAQEVGTPAAVGCAAHGVFGVRVTGVSSDGKGEDVTVPCTPGQFGHSVASGTWTFVVHALDAEG